MTGPAGAALRNTALKAQHPRIDDPIEAINFALDHTPLFAPIIARDFLTTWREGAWNEIEQAYPEFLSQVEACK